METFSIYISTKKWPWVKKEKIFKRERNKKQSRQHNKADRFFKVDRELTFAIKEHCNSWRSGKEKTKNFPLKTKQKLNCILLKIKLYNGEAH